MGSKQIRTGQIIAPFGPGSVYTDRRGVPHVVCGLDHWYFRSDSSNTLVPCEDRGEFELIEPRLSSLLHVDRFGIPPDFRYSRRGPTPPNAKLPIPAQRFPRWYRQSRTSEMRRFNLHTTRIEACPGGGRWQPVRFIAVCAGGHLCEFPWKQWIGCNCPDDGDLILTDRGGSELSSISVQCQSCPSGSTGRKGKTISGTTVKPDTDAGETSAFQRAGITCPGERPWLGEDANEFGCKYPLVGALINQTNIYFPRTISAIMLPDLRPENASIRALRNVIEAEPTAGVAKTLWNMKQQDNAIAMMQPSLKACGIEASTEEVQRAMASIFAPGPAALPPGTMPPAKPESELLSFRRAEFDIIRNTVDAVNIPHLRVVSTTVADELSTWLAKVNLVERLRETRVFYGFDRLVQESNPLAGMPESAMQQLFRTPPTQPQDRWLPAIKVYGEGLYFELREDRLTAWQAQHAAWLKGRLNEPFLLRLSGISQTLPPQGVDPRAWASRYLLVHTLAHIILNQLVFECGYSTASLRERLYVSADPVAPMAGFLIYTAAGDADGTLGGLVRLGLPERLGPVVQRAISRATWCSADPVCSEHLGGKGSRLVNLAACHACTLLPETSCETINEGLDRAVVVGTPSHRDVGFMSELASTMPTAI